MQTFGNSDENGSHRIQRKLSLLLGHKMEELILILCIFLLALIIIFFAKVIEVCSYACKSGVRACITLGIGNTAYLCYVTFLMYSGLRMANTLGHASIRSMHDKGLQVDDIGINSRGGSEWTLTLQLLHYVIRPSAQWQILTTMDCTSSHIKLLDILMLAKPNDSH